MPDESEGTTRGATYPWADTRSPKPRLSSTEASAYLLEQHGIHVARATLDKYRCVGGGPSFHRFGKRVLYLRDTLDSWAMHCLGQPLDKTSRT